jgi:outer membrane protein assembly factor BamA
MSTCSVHSWKSIFVSVPVPMTFRAVLICFGCLAILSPPVSAQTPVRPYGCPVLLDDIDTESVPLPVVLHDVRFDGEISLSKSELEDFVSGLKQTGLFATPRWVDGIAEDVERMWLDHGYSQVIVEPEARTFSVDAEGEHVFLTFHINEGTKRWLKEIRFSEKGSTISDLEMSISESRTRHASNSLLNQNDASPNPRSLPAFSLDQLRRLIPIRDGDVFSTTKLYEGVDALETLYKSEGYAEFSVTPTIALDDKDHSASVTVELDEGEQFHVGKVEALGIDAAFAERLQVALPKGEIFHRTALDTALKSVLPDAPANRVRLNEHKREATVDITIDLRPCPPAERSVQE